MNLLCRHEPDHTCEFCEKPRNYLSEMAAKDAEIAELKASLADSMEHAERGWNLAQIWKNKCQSIAEQVRERLLGLRWQSVYSEMQSPRVMNLAKYVEAIRTADLSDLVGKK